MGLRLCSMLRGGGGGVLGEVRRQRGRCGLEVFGFRSIV